MFKLKDMSFKYDSMILEGISCDVTVRKTGIIGNNGCGKTTLLHLLNHDLIPTTGIVESSSRSYMADFSIKSYADFTVEELIELCLKFDCFNDNFKSLIEMLNLQDFLNMTIKTLSLGNTKKVFIMMGLSFKCDHLLLDEPFDNLDESTNKNLVKYISDLNGTDITIVSHNIDYLAACVEKIYTISEKKLVLV